MSTMNRLNYNIIQKKITTKKKVKSDKWGLISLGDRLKKTKRIGQCLFQEIARKFLFPGKRPENFTRERNGLSDQTNIDYLEKSMEETGSQSTQLTEDEIIDNFCHMVLEEFLIKRQLSSTLQTFREEWKRPQEVNYLPTDSFGKKIKAYFIIL